MHPQLRIHHPSIPPLPHRRRAARMLEARRHRLLDTRPQRLLTHHIRSRPQLDRAQRGHGLGCKHAAVQAQRCDQDIEIDGVREDVEVDGGLEERVGAG